MTDVARNGHNRRTVLKNGLLVLGGAIGLGGGAAGARALVDGGTPKGARRLELGGTGWVLRTPDRKPGERLQSGDRGTVTGVLTDRRTGKERGRFYGTRMAFASGLGPHETADASTELHTFSLDDGTILGMGSVLGGESLFTVVGGTGRYVGIRGTYRAEQRLRELGGDGTASFVIDLQA